MPCTASQVLVKPDLVRFERLGRETRANILSSYLGNEEKPRCRRCAGAGAACKYVTHISFKDENLSQMLPDNVGSNLIGTSTSSTKYRTIRVSTPLDKNAQISNLSDVFMFSSSTTMAAVQEAVLDLHSARLMITNSANKASRLMQLKFLPIQA